MKIFKKEKLGNGRRHIYFCGIKILSYKHKNHTYVVHNTEVPLRYISEDRLPQWLWDNFYKRTGKIPTDDIEFLNEKIIWAAMFDVTPLKIQCADKYAVRDYVKKAIGEKYLPKIYAVYNNSSDFDINKLPKQFVLTFNAGSGQNLIVADKNTLNIDDTRKLIKQWMLYNHSELLGEMQYRYIKPLVIARELVDIREEVEYKLWCFGGKVEFIQVVSYLHGHDHIHHCHFDRNWNLLPFYRCDKTFVPEYEKFEKPKFLDELIKVAEKLAKPFDFVRVDFYETKSGKLVFGELTFSPTAGTIEFSPNNEEMQKYFGKKFKLPKRDANGFAIHPKKISK